MMVVAFPIVIGVGTARNGGVCWEHLTSTMGIWQWGFSKGKKKPFALMFVGVYVPVYISILFVCEYMYVRVYVFISACPVCV